MSAIDAVGRTPMGRAEVELISSPQGITPDLIAAMVARAREIASETVSGKPPGTHREPAGADLA